MCPSRSRAGPIGGLWPASESVRGLKIPTEGSASGRGISLSGERALRSEGPSCPRGGKVRLLGPVIELLGGVVPRASSRLLTRAETSLRLIVEGWLLGGGEVRIDDEPVGVRLLRAESRLASAFGGVIRVFDGERLALFDISRTRDGLLPVIVGVPPPSEGGLLFRPSDGPPAGEPNLPAERLVPSAEGTRLRLGEDDWSRGASIAGPPRETPGPPLDPRLKDRLESCGAALPGTVPRPSRPCRWAKPGVAITVQAMASEMASGQFSLRILVVRSIAGPPARKV